MTWGNAVLERAANSLFHEVCGGAHIDDLVLVGNGAETFSPCLKRNQSIKLMITRETLSRLV